MQPQRFTLSVALIIAFTLNAFSQPASGFLQKETERHFNLYFGPAVYPFKAETYDWGVSSSTELGAAAGLDFPVGKSNIGIKYTYFDCRDNVELYWTAYPGIDDGDMSIGLVDIYLQRQYNLVNKLDAYGQLGVSFKSVKGYYIETSDYDTEIPIDYTTAGVFFEAGFKYRLPRFLAVKTGFYQNIMLKGSSVTAIPFLAINIYF